MSNFRIFNFNFCFFSFYPIFHFLNFCLIFNFVSRAVDGNYQACFITTFAFAFCTLQRKHFFHYYTRPDNIDKTIISDTLSRMFLLKRSNRRRWKGSLSEQILWHIFHTTTEPSRKANKRFFGLRDKLLLCWNTNGYHCK